jgi:hypothetical protein
MGSRVDRIDCLSESRNFISKAQFYFQSLGKKMEFHMQVVGPWSDNKHHHKYYNATISDVWLLVMPKGYTESDSQISVRTDEAVKRRPSVQKGLMTWFRGWQVGSKLNEPLQCKWVAVHCAVWKWFSSKFHIRHLLTACYLDDNEVSREYMLIIFIYRTAKEQQIGLCTARRYNCIHCTGQYSQRCQLLTWSRNFPLFSN